MILTIDASVFISASRQQEVHHAESMAFMQWLDANPTPVTNPTLALTETAAAIGRVSQEIGLANRTVAMVEALQDYTNVGLTVTRARASARLAISYRLRGADAVYVQVAREFGTVLVTWDNEMLQRASAVVRTVTPAEFLTAVQTPPYP
jgi:predicted nucleic acid-binding protein